MESVLEHIKDALVEALSSKELEEVEPSLALAVAMQGKPFALALCPKCVPRAWIWASFNKIPIFGYTRFHAQSACSTDGCRNRKDIVEVYLLSQYTGDSPEPEVDDEAYHPPMPSTDMDVA